MTKDMTKEEAEKMFRRVYPESTVSIISISPVEELCMDDSVLVIGFLVNADTPEGYFHFGVTTDSVTPGRVDWKEAYRDVNSIVKARRESHA